MAARTRRRRGLWSPRTHAHRDGLVHGSSARTADAVRARLLAAAHRIARGGRLRRGDRRRTMDRIQLSPLRPPPADLDAGRTHTRSEQLRRRLLRAAPRVQVADRPRVQPTLAGGGRRLLPGQRRAAGPVPPKRCGRMRSCDGSRRNTSAATAADSPSLWLHAKDGPGASSDPSSNFGSTSSKATSDSSGPNTSSISRCFPPPSPEPSSCTAAEHRSGHCSHPSSSSRSPSQPPSGAPATALPPTSPSHSSPPSRSERSSTRHSPLADAPFRVPPKPRFGCHSPPK